MGKRAHVVGSRILAAFLLLLSAPAVAQDRDFGAVEIETIDLGAGTYMMLGLGGNLGLSAGDDGVLLIDNQFAALTDKISAAIADITADDVTFVLNTHWHGDHTGGNENYGGGGAIIVAHDNVRKRLSQGQFLKVWNRQEPPAPQAALPVVTFSTDMTLHFNSQTIQIIAVPNAHTDGDAIIYFEQADVLHMGDTYINTGNYPYIDRESGGSLGGYIAALDRGLAIAGPETRIIPGHGPLSTRDDMQQYRDAVAGMQAAVVSLVDQGLGLEQIQTVNPLADYDAVWGNGMTKREAFIETIYSESAGQ